MRNDAAAHLTPFTVPLHVVARERRLSFWCLSTQSGIRTPSVNCCLFPGSRPPVPHSNRAVCGAAAERRVRCCPNDLRWECLWELWDTPFLKTRILIALVSRACASGNASLAPAARSGAGPASERACTLTAVSGDQQLHRVPGQRALASAAAARGRLQHRVHSANTWAKGTTRIVFHATGPARAVQAQLRHPVQRSTATARH